MRFQRNAVIGLVVLSGASALCLHNRVKAAPAKLVPAKPLPPRPDAPHAVSTSPSVRHAAQLKYYPPPGWIRHYLGDDRYKIDGNIWRVVSTQMDTYYHRPNCPNMMRQSADIVLGFPSGEDAVEAGYKPDPFCHPEEPVVEYSGAMPTMPGMGMSASGVPQTVTLADGTSTVTLPVGWQRLSTMARNFQGQSVSIDVFSHGVAQRGKALMVLRETAPANVNLDTWLTPQSFRANLQGNNSILNSTGAVNSNLNNLNNVFSGLTAKSATLGGLPGLLLTAKSPKAIPGLTGPLYVVHRGQQAYIVVDATNGAPGANAVLKSLRFK